MLMLPLIDTICWITLLSVIEENLYLVLVLTIFNEGAYLT